MARKRVRALKKIRHARGLVASIINSVEHDEMPLDKAKLLIYGANILGQLIKDADGEADIAQLRQELAELKAKIGLRVA